ncbi:MAG: DUF5801 domain-containing protein [Desulfobacterales bacterium]|nr:DUF5801 domain-containing protein [Desulfobacterales bacterium]
MEKAGIVQSIIGTGTLKAVGPNGTTRVLEQGDDVFVGETLVTEGNVSVVIYNEETSQEIATLGPNESRSIDETVTTKVAEEDSTVKEVEAMQAALEQGEEIPEEETAAGEEEPFTSDLESYEGDESSGGVDPKSLGAAPETASAIGRADVRDYDDDVPVVSAIDVYVDESPPETDFLGLDGEPFDTVTGAITVDYGTATGSLTLAAIGATWDAGSNTLTYEQDGEDIWQIVLDQDSGEFTFTQLAAFDHGPDNNNHNALAEFGITVTATNSEGNSASTTFTAGIYDDGPSIRPEPEEYDDYYPNDFFLRASIEDPDGVLEVEGDEGSQYPVGKYVSAEELGIDFGTDGPGDVALSMDPDDPNWEWNPDLYDGEGGLIYYQGEGEDREPAWIMGLVEEQETGTSVDRWTLDHNGGALTIDMLSELNGAIIDGDGETSDLDIMIRLYDADGNHVVYDDDGGLGTDGSTHYYDSFLHFGDLSAGTYTLYVSSYWLNQNEALNDFNDDGPAGDYQVTITGDTTVSTMVGNIISDDSGVVVGQGTIVDQTETQVGYYFQQLNPIDHAEGTDQDDTMHWDVTMTVTDSDGDYIEVPISIDIDDDEPSIWVDGEGMDVDGPLLDVSEDAYLIDDTSPVPVSYFFDWEYGVDGPGNVAYELTLDLPDGEARGSGLYTHDGDEILLKLDNGQIVGFDGEGDGEIVYFTISLNEYDEVVFDQQNPIRHDYEGRDREYLSLAYMGLLATITDADGDTDTAFIDFSQYSFAIDDSVPEARDNSYELDENTSIVMDILANDDLSGDNENEAGEILGGTTVTINGGGPANGSLTENPDGTFIYTPDPDFYGSDSYSYTLTDADGDTSTATVNITVNENFPPEALDKYITVDEAHEAFTMSEDVSDPNNDDSELTITIDTLPDYGTLFYTNADGDQIEIDAPGAFTLTQSEFDSLEYVINQDVVLDEAVDFFLGTDGDDPLDETSDWGTTTDGGLTYVTEVLTDAGTIYARVSGLNPDGTDAPLGFQDSPTTQHGVGIGVAGDVGDNQINTDRDYQSETLVLEFDNGTKQVDVTNVIITFSGLGPYYVEGAEENAHVHWIARSADGSVVAEGYENKDDTWPDDFGEAQIEVLKPDGTPATFTTLEVSINGGSADEVGWGNATIKSFQVTSVVDDSFDYTVTDPGGESDSATVYFDLNEYADRSALIVGSNLPDDDALVDTDPEAVYDNFIVAGPDPDTDIEGTINGSGFDDLIAGDGGGASEGLDPTGSDIINGGDGDDIIFGDVMNTDSLEGSSLPDGSGWEVFQELEDNTGNSWYRDNTLQYIEENHEELAEESGREGGDDTIHGGEGDDIIYGQEGDDTIYGEEGNDTIDGGSGDDWIDGGSGIDTLRVTDATLDFSNLTDELISLEAIHLGNDGEGQSIINLTAQDVFDLSDTDSLTISGNSDDESEDSVILFSSDGWSQDGDTNSFISGGASIEAVNVSVSLDGVIKTFDQDGNDITVVP